MKIADIDIPSNVMLAPMAGVTDLVYRRICREQGCECAVTEMINARALSYNNKNTLKMLRTDKGDKPLGIQLVGSQPKYFIQAIEKLADIEYDFIDLNAACPVKKVVNNGEGSSLMRDPVLLSELLKIIKKESKKPVTIKIRSGWCDEEKNAVEVATLAQDCGVSAIFVHGRTKQQHYSGSVDASVIRRVKEAVNVPVIGSGDIFTPQDVKSMLEDTGCDGVLIARGSYGNPWIFNQTKDIVPDVNMVADMMAYHLEGVCQLYGHDHGVQIFRKIFVWYTKTFMYSKELRKKVFTLNLQSEVLEIIDQFRNRCSRFIVNV